MKQALLLSLILFLSAENINSFGRSPESDSVETYTEWEDLYRFQNFFISGQPELKELEWLKEQGVTKIISLRTEKENKEFAKKEFNEKKEAKKLGLDFYSLPIDGTSEYNPANLDKFMDLLEPEDKVIIHCKSGGRANSFFMAYMVKELGYSVDRSVHIGKQILFKLPLEELLGVEIHMEIAE